MLNVFRIFHNPRDVIKVVTLGDTNYGFWLLLTLEIIANGAKYVNNAFAK